MRVGITRDIFHEKLVENGYVPEDDDEYVSPIDNPDNRLDDRVSLDGWFNVQQLEALVKTMKECQ